MHISGSSCPNRVIRLIFTFLGWSLSVCCFASQCIVVPLVHSHMILHYPTEVRNSRIISPAISVIFHISVLRKIRQEFHCTPRTSSRPSTPTPMAWALELPAARSWPFFRLLHNPRMGSREVTWSLWMATPSQVSEGLYKYRDLQGIVALKAETTT